MDTQTAELSLTDVKSPVEVLHVDDDPEFARMTADLLEERHERLCVRTEPDPETVPDEERLADVDCILSDYDMPRMDGLELLQAVRKMNVDCPFILYTGKGSEEIASEAISDGVTDYLQKASGRDHYVLLGNRIRNAVSEYRKHRALRESEERYRALVEGSPNAVCIVKRGEIVYANRRFVDLLDADDRSRVIGRSPAEVVHLEEQEALAERLERLERGKSNGRHEGRIETFDGETKHVEVADSSIVYDGEPAGHVVLSDISERKRYEREVEAAKRKFESVFEHSNDAIFVVDVEADEILDCNRAATDLVGYSRAELLSMSASDLHPHNLPEFMQFAESVLEEGHGWTDELTCRGKNDDRIPSEISASVCDIDGRTCVISNIRDISERKERERELERVRQRMEFALKRTDSVIWELDPATDEMRTYPEPCPVLGGTIEETGDLLDRIHSADRPRVAEILRTSSETGEAKQMEVRTRERLDADWIELQIEPISDDDTVALVTGFGRDITERKEREQELERQNGRLDEFASVVSHDLRSPLRTAKGRLALASEEHESEHIGAIGDSIDRMDRMIEDLLTLAREGEEGRDPEPIDLAEFCRECWRTVETDGIELSVDVDRTVRADRRQLERLFENLFRNAAEHGSADDRPRADERLQSDAGLTLTIGGLSDGFYVADDGTGIPRSERDRIFESGYSTSDDGIGIGLSIVGRIVDAHGWELRVTDSDGGGARFEITGVE
jgi:PAS domain S-box-containing protein